MSDNDLVFETFRALVESADRKFARVRDVPAYGRVSQNHFYLKVFKAYTRLWKYQQENRSKLVQCGLKRWEIGEIASRIGQLYFGQYMRTSECRYLVEAYVFYEAILNRRYFEGSEGSSKDPGIRFKELRFYARFLLVSVILNRMEMVKHLMDRFMALLDDCKSNFRETNLKEWRQVVQEIVRFTKAENGFAIRPLRYCAITDTHQASLPYVARFHAKRVLKFRDALLTSYHRNEVKFAELTLDSYRMLQCLEWEPSGLFNQKPIVKPLENGDSIDHSGTSGLINMNLAADMTDPNVPPNPRKAVLYRPSVTHLIAVMAAICEELPPDSVVLVYLSGSGYLFLSVKHQSIGLVILGWLPCLSLIQGRLVIIISISWRILEGHRNIQGTKSFLRLPRSRAVDLLTLKSTARENPAPITTTICGLVPRASKVQTIFTLAILFLSPANLFSSLLIVITAMHSRQVLRGAERGETAAMFLSPLMPVFKNPSDVNLQNGSQFTFFLTAPLSAFCQMVGLSPIEVDKVVYDQAENILANAFAEWEIILCSSTTSLDLVWAQIITDPFLRRLILRFIFCRSAISFYCPPEEREQYLPLCLPHLPTLVAPGSGAVRTAIVQIATHFEVADSFHFSDT